MNPSGTRPYLTRGINFLNEEQWIDEPLPAEPIEIDLWQTRITDISNAQAFPGIGGSLGDFFSINPKGGLRLELAVAQVADNRTDDGPLNKALTTTGTDARFTDLFTVGPPPAGVDVSATNQTTLMMIDATGAGIYATTDDMPDGAEVDLKYDSTGQKIGIATAFLQAPSS